MNYIKHLTGFFEKVSIDFDLNPTHISLYMSVFQLWNKNRFQNPIGISRDELMRISKIASSATYHKCMKELNDKGYVIYKPSYNPFKGSTLEVINLDYYTKPILKKEIKKLKNNSKSFINSDQVNDQVSNQVSEQVLNKHQTSTKHVPYININKHIKHGKQSNNELLEDASTKKNNHEFDDEKLSEKKSTTLQTIPPEWKEVQNFFLEQKNTQLEAEKFYNHFQSNGWLVGGKSKMKDWKAAARNWIINADKFQTKSNTPQPNHLHTQNQKNYSEPL